MRMLAKHGDCNTVFLKERYWKYLLSVGKVIQAFEQLRANFS